MSFTRKMELFLMARSQNNFFYFFPIPHIVLIFLRTENWRLACSFSFYYSVLNPCRHKRKIFIGIKINISAMSGLPFWQFIKFEQNDVTNRIEEPWNGFEIKEMSYSKWKFHKMEKFISWIFSQFDQIDDSVRFNPLIWVRTDNLAAVIFIQWNADYFSIPGNW